MSSEKKERVKIKTEKIKKLKKKRDLDLKKVALLISKINLFQDKKKDLERKKATKTIRLDLNRKEKSIEEMGKKLSLIQKEIDVMQEEIELLEHEIAMRKSKD